MNLHIKSPGELPGVYPIARRGKDLKYLSFTIVEMAGNLKEHSFDSGEEEICLDFYSGPVRVEAETTQGHWSAEVGGRPSINQAGSMVYLPSGSRVKLSLLDGAAKVSIAGAACMPGVKPLVIVLGVTTSHQVVKHRWDRTH